VDATTSTPRAGCSSSDGRPGSHSATAQDSRRAVPGTYRGETRRALPLVPPTGTPARILDAWPTLPEHIKAAIRAVAATAC
jgi:hypothetical protein